MGAYSDGSGEHTIWQTTGSQSGAATVGGYFSISESGDSFDHDAWTLQNLNCPLAITGFTMLRAPGGTTFDRTFGGQIGTPNTALGKNLDISGSYTVIATCSDILNLRGQPAAGDEFVSLGVAFGPCTGFGPGASAACTRDAGNAGGNITVPDAGSTGLMLGLGLAALAVLKRQVDTDVKTFQGRVIRRANQ